MHAYIQICVCENVLFLFKWNCFCCWCCWCCRGCCYCAVWTILTRKEKNEIKLFFFIEGQTNEHWLQRETKWKKPPPTPPPLSHQNTIIVTTTRVQRLKKTKKRNTWNCNTHKSFSILSWNEIFLNNKYTHTCIHMHIHSRIKSL